MDVWEHAFVVESTANPAGRSQYIEACFNNVDWNTVAKRLV